MSGELIRLENDLYFDRVHDETKDDLRVALDLLERARGVVLGVQAATGEDYGCGWLRDYADAKGA